MPFGSEVQVECTRAVRVQVQVQINEPGLHPPSLNSLLRRPNACERVQSRNDRFHTGVETASAAKRTCLRMHAGRQLAAAAAAGRRKGRLGLRVKEQVVQKEVGVLLLDR